MQRNSSLPKRLDELIHAIKAETVFSGVADITGHVLGMELVLQGKMSITYPKATGDKNEAYPEVPAACQACKTNDFVVGLAEPSDFPAAQVIDRRDSVRCGDAKCDGDSAVSGPIG